MEDVRKQIDALIEEGQYFTYRNFSSKTASGFPAAYAPEWIAWKTRITTIIKRLFGDGSAPMNLLQAGLGIGLLGKETKEFEQVKSYFLHALQTAAQIIEQDTFRELLTQGATACGNYSNKVFVVHGHNDKAKSELEVLLTEIGLEPIVLHRQPDEGQTIIEKFEKHSDVGYAFVLLTPDEVAYLSKQKELPDNQRDKENRARPNVIFEFGYFVGKLGRQRVCCLHTGGVALPSDLSGLLYKKFEHSVEEVAYNVIKELKACCYQLK